MMDILQNDIAVSGGDMSVAQNSDAIQQDLQQALQLWFGEWFLDTTKGLPFKQSILVKNPNLDDVQALIMNAALAVPGVAQLTGFSFNYDSTGRALSVFIEVEDTNGQTLTVSPSIGLPTNGTPQGTV